LKNEIRYLEDWLKDGTMSRRVRKSVGCCLDLLRRLSDRCQQHHHDRLLFDHKEIKRLHLTLSEYRSDIAVGVERLKAIDIIVEIVRIQAQNSINDMCAYCLFGTSKDKMYIPNLNKRCTVCGQDKSLEDFKWIIYGDDTEHVEITLKPDMMDRFEDCLREEIEQSRRSLKKNQERQKNEEFCDCHSYIDTIRTSNRVLELIIFSKIHKITDYELTNLPSDILSRVQQERELRFRPDIDDVNELYEIISSSLLLSKLDNEFFDNKKLKKITYLLETIRRQVQDFGDDICRGCATRSGDSEASKDMEQYESEPNEN